MTIKGADLAHLTDMEELLSRIPATEVRSYMREAMNCYMAGAYRGAVVLSYIALFDDLLTKLGELASVNSTAKAIHSGASKRKADQDVYESFLIDQLTSSSLISGLDSSFLTTLRALRNKSAHPSGHSPSPEEARFVFYEVVNRFLSKPVLSTTRLTDELIARLKNSNFFPSTLVSDVESVVREETSTLHEEALPLLIVKLSGEVLSTDNATSTNAKNFLIGLSRQDTSATTLALRSKLIEARADAADFHDAIIQCISANGKLAHGLTATTVARLKALLAKSISGLPPALSETKLSHPTAAIVSVSKVIPEREFVAIFREEIEALFAKRSHSIFLAELAKEKPSLASIYVPALISRAGSADFGTANSFSIALDSLDPILDNVLTDEQSLELILATMGAAKMNAWSAKAVVGARFSGAPRTRSRAVRFSQDNSAAAEAMISSALDEKTSAADFIAAHLTDETS